MTQQTPHAVLLQEGRRGDDAQLQALADALGWPHTRVRVRRSLVRVALDRLTASLGLPGDREAVARVGPPWPDAVFVIGGRSIGLARHVRRRSGGRTRIVALGRPWAPLDQPDLVITTPQYKLPADANVVHNHLPLNTLDPARLAAGAAAWRPRVADLPGPCVTVLLGGNSSTHVFDAATARRLAALASERAGELGGSVLACGSPRTPAAAVEAFAAALTVPNRVIPWRPDAADNPLAGFVALGERLLVTGESASMVAETLRTGKPVETVELPLRRRAAVVTKHLPHVIERLGLGRPCAGLSAALTRRGLWVPPRDLGRVHEALAAAGGPTAEVPAEDVARACAAVRALIAAPREAAGPADASVRPAA
ncbi:hypothetical protein SAMN05216241_106181 [Limimonas halophila]|uniref:Fission protein ELM1 n=1 Tax=Limimonas halophila TaxID=1082479 RepID=A0A1G7SAM5_9PROT|nr:ELM1/GtrOC1 family putative glycosyltransferase [Limimonas halophila]SDG19984.1 hypothetical protein SAMN05216241_106181 [Limimonas halophila]